MVAAIAAPDARLDEVVHAIVELQDGDQASEAEIIEFCNARMAGFRVPRGVRFVMQWPMTGTGKIQRRALIEQFVSRSAENSTDSEKDSR